MSVSKVIEELTGDIESIVKDFSTPSKFVSPPVLGIPLEYRIDAASDIEAIYKAARNHDAVLEAWLDNSGDSIWLIMGRDSWSAVRKDRLGGSPVWNIKNAPPLGSFNRPQLVRISAETAPVRRALTAISGNQLLTQPARDTQPSLTTSSISNPSDVRAGSRLRAWPARDSQPSLTTSPIPISSDVRADSPVEIISSFQSMIWFVQASLRLNAHETWEAIRRVRSFTMWAQWPLQIVSGKMDGVPIKIRPEHSLYPSLMIGNQQYRTLKDVVYKALSHPVEHKYGPQLQLAFGDMKRLHQLQQLFQTSAAERNITNKWLLLAVRKGKTHYEACRLLRPSFFVKLSIPDVHPHVHFLDLPVASYHSALLISSSVALDISSIKKTLEEISTHMNVSNRWLHSEPLRHQPYQVLFRADGM